MLLATAADDTGGPAACLRFAGTTVLARLVAQVRSIGVRSVTVLTRPAWRESCTAALAAGPEPEPWSVLACADLGADLRAVARAAATAPGPLLVADADLAASREAFAGLLLDPRIPTGALLATTAPDGVDAAPLRLARGRLVSAGSAWHLVRAPNAVFLGVLLVDTADRPALAAAASDLADLADSAALVRSPASAAGADAAEAAVSPAAADAANGAARGDTWPDRPAARPSPVDVPALLLVGLVRRNVTVGTSHLRSLFLARPDSVVAARAAEAGLAAVDEDRVLLDSAVKSSDGFFTTFLVSPYSRFVARWAARHGVTPNQVTTLSMALGALAAGAFATGSRAGLVAGAVLLQVAFTADCVDGQIARYTRTFSALGAWLDAVFDRGKEYLVYAGLAVGSVRGFGDDVWLLAAGALLLQTVRHAVDFSYAAVQHRDIAVVSHPPLDVAADAAVRVDGEIPDEDDVAAPVLVGVGARDAGGSALPALPASPHGDRPPAGELRGAVPAAEPAPRAPASGLGRGAIRLSRALERRGWMRYGKKIVVLPIGERFALISITAALGSPRTTFLALLVWGGGAAAYSVTGKVMRSVAG